MPISKLDDIHHTNIELLQSLVALQNQMVAYKADASKANELNQTNNQLSLLINQISLLSNSPNNIVADKKEKSEIYMLLIETLNEMKRNTFDVKIPPYIQNNFVSAPQKSICKEIDTLRRQYSWAQPNWNETLFSKHIKKYLINANQIGEYVTQPSERAKQQTRVNNIIASAGAAKIDPLYDGISEYEKGHLAKVNAYRAKQNMSPLQANQGDYFRRQFVELLKKIEDDPNHKQFTDDLKLRESNPDSATISLESFLGKEGAALYVLALEEERFSKAYMNEVLNKSTNEYKGKKWAERPLIIVGGPSSSGKSYAADEAVKASEAFLKKDNTSSDDSINYVVSVDGGVSREISQMRKLIIKMANEKGYTGISDLHSKSSALEDVKKCVHKFALQDNNNHGVVIPETFSTYSGILKHDTIEAVANSPNCKPIFCRVVGKNPDKFREVVKFMGSRRAWKTNWGTPTDFDMNNSRDLSESKIYEPQYFGAGDRGSRLAVKEFKNRVGKNYISLRVVNDLVLKKEDKPSQWVDASPDDEGVIKVSQRVFDNWESAQRAGTTTQTLRQFMDDKKNRLPAEINLSSLMGLTNEELRIRMLISTLNSQTFKDSESEIKRDVEVSKLKTLFKEVNNLNTQVNEKQFKDINVSIVNVIKMTKEILSNPNVSSETANTLNGVLFAANKMKNQLMPVSDSASQQFASLEKLEKICEASGGKRKDYMDEFILQMNEDNSNQWQTDLKNASVAFLQFRKDSDRGKLTAELEKCGYIGALLDNSKVIDRDAPYAIKALSIVEGILDLQLEVKTKMQAKTPPSISPRSASSTNSATISASPPSTTAAIVTQLQQTSAATPTPPSSSASIAASSTPNISDTSNKASRTRRAGMTKQAPQIQSQSEKTTPVPSQSEKSWGESRFRSDSNNNTADEPQREVSPSVSTPGKRR